MVAVIAANQPLGAGLGFCPQAFRLGFNIVSGVVGKEHRCIKGPRIPAGAAPIKRVCLAGWFWGLGVTDPGSAAAQRVNQPKTSKSEARLPEFQILA